LNGSFDQNANNWTNGTSPANFFSFGYASGRLHTGLPAPPSSNPNISHYFISDQFNLNSVGVTGSTFNVDLDCDLVTCVFSGGSPQQINPLLRIELVFPNASTKIVDTLMSNGNKHYTAKFTYAVTGNFKLKISIVPYNYPQTVYRIIDAYFDNIVGIPTYTAALTLDKYYQAYITGTTAIETVDNIIYFGDAFQKDDVGAMLLYSNLTDSWGNYNGVSGYSLQKLYAYNVLTLSSRFKDYLRISIWDTQGINYNNILQINSKKYAITGYSNDLKNNRLDLELVEYLNTSIGVMALDATTINSVDGEDIN
jgi:hypothetical protein